MLVEQVVHFVPPMGGAIHAVPNVEEFRSTGDWAKVTCPICKAIRSHGEEQVPDVPAPELTPAEELGLVVAAAYGRALAERDMAVTHLRAVLDATPVSSFAHANIVTEAAEAWLADYDLPDSVDSPETPEQEITGP